MQVDRELQTAIALVFGEPTPVDIDRIDVQRLIMLLKKNRVPVAVLPEGPTLQKLRQYSEFETFFQREQERYNYALNAYSEVFSAWTKANIKAVLIKSPGYFPYTSDNIDVLVSNTQADQAVEVLQQLGYVELLHIREPYKKLFRKIKEPYIGFPIHLHTGVAWINNFLTDAEVVSSCQRLQEDSIIVYPSAEHILMITTAHWLYEDKELKLRDLYHTYLALSGNIDWKYIWELATQRGWHEDLRFGLLVYALASQHLNIQMFNERLPNLSKDNLPKLLNLYFNKLSQRSFTLPLRLSKILCKGLGFKKTIKDQTLSIGQKLKEVYLLILFALKVKFSHLLRKKCFVVALSGPDGAGKTTIARNLQDFLNTLEIQARYHWIRLGYSKGLEVIKMPLTLVSRIISHTPALKTTSQVSSSKQVVAKRFLERHPRLRTLWGYVLAGDFLMRLWMRLFWAKIIGGIHIFDRYTVDAAVDLAIVYKFAPARWVVKLALKPNLSILIWINKEEALKRGAVLPSPDYLEKSLYFYQKYQDYHLKLSGSETPKYLLEQIMRLIFKMYL
jgi:hypothetical protein